MGLRKGMLLLLITLLIGFLGFSGCIYTKTVILHPIEKADIYSVRKGAQIYHVDGSKDTVDRDGWFFSDMYVKEVIKARIDK